MGNMSASDLDVADRTKFDKVKPNYCTGFLLSFVLEVSYIFFLYSSKISPF